MGEREPRERTALFPRRSWLATLLDLVTVATVLALLLTARQRTRALRSLEVAGLMEAFSKELDASYPSCRCSRSIGASPTGPSRRPSKLWREGSAAITRNTGWISVPSPRLSALRPSPPRPTTGRGATWRWRASRWRRPTGRRRLAEYDDLRPLTSCPRVYVLAAVAGDHDADVWLDLLDQKRGRGYSPAEVPGDAIPRAFCRASVHRWQGHAEGAANWQQTVDALQGLVTTPRAELLGVYAGL